MSMHAALVRATLAPENLAALEAEIREQIAARIRDYADDTACHVERFDGTCIPTAGDRCDIVAAYRHAADIARGQA